MRPFLVTTFATPKIFLGIGIGLMIVRYFPSFVCLSLTLSCASCWNIENYVQHSFESCLIYEASSPFPVSLDTPMNGDLVQFSLTLIMLDFFCHFSYFGRLQGLKLMKCSPRGHTCSYTAGNWMFHQRQLYGHIHTRGVPHHITSKLGYF